MADLSGIPSGPDWGRVAKGVGLVLLVAVVGVFVAAAAPQVVGADRSYVVLSDSMSPTIDAGSVVFVQEADPGDISEGDVITFARAGGGETVTHRVVEVIERDGDRQFRTKGDANEDPDPEPVPGERVVGVAAFDVPLIGYVVALAKTPLGIVALIVVPAVLLVVTEIWDIYTSTGDDETTDADGQQ